jgi:hypothetical protein
MEREEAEIYLSRAEESRRVAALSDRGKGAPSLSRLGVIIMTGAG